MLSGARFKSHLRQKKKRLFGTSRALPGVLRSKASAPGVADAVASQLICTYAFPQKRFLMQSHAFRILPL